MSERKITEVAAAIIRRNGRIFLCRRGEGGPCAFLWEFPGGKLEPGESPESCLIRECAEELGVALAIDGPYDQVEYTYPDKTVRLHFYDARIVSGEPELRVHTAAAWCHPRELANYQVCPADEQLVKRLSGELPFSAYLWDFDGTLFDTYPRMTAALVAVFRDFGHQADFDETMRLSKKTIPHAIGTLMDKFGLNVPMDALRASYRTHEKGYVPGDSAPPYPGIPELLKEIIRRGGRHYLYTHRGASALDYLAGWNMAHLFSDSVIGLDTYPPKPAPDAVLALMERNGLRPSRTVMVGDRDIDVLAGQNAGAAGCFFDPDHFFDGYDPGMRAGSIGELGALLL